MKLLEMNRKVQEKDSTLKNELRTRYSAAIVRNDVKRE